MNRRDAIVVMEKTITGERSRISATTSEEALFMLHYILEKIFKLNPYEVEALLDSAFLKEYNLLRYSRLVEMPRHINAKHKRVSYLLHLLYPDIFTYDQDETLTEEYIKSLSPFAKKQNTVWNLCKNLPDTSKVVYWALSQFLDYESEEELLYFAYREPKTMEEILRTLKFGTILEEMYYCPLDMVFFSLPLTLQREQFPLYLRLRSRLGLGGDELISQCLAASEQKGSKK